LADPLVTATVDAVTRGYLDLRTYEDTPRWWAQARLRIRASKRVTDIATATLEAQRLIAEVAVPGIRIEEARRVAKDAVQVVRDLMYPWANGLPAGGGDDLDLLARWYILNAPDRLRALGVDFGPLEPTS
jgi:hypothetical protein